MIEIVSRPGGCLFPVRAKPASRRNEIQGEHAGALKISVAAPPEKGKANDAVLDLLADALGAPRTALTIVRGRSSASKTIHWAGVDAHELRAILDSCTAAATKPPKRG